MKFNKAFMSLTAIAMSGMLLAACGSNDKTASKDKSESSSVKKDSSKKEEAPKKQVAGADLKDGTYKLEEKNYSNGYRVVFAMTVKDGKISESNYDYLNKDGKSKKVDKDYNEQMQKVSKTSPKKYIPTLNEELVKAGNPSGVEVVSGATGSANTFKNYAQQLVQAAQAGNTETIMVDNGAKLQDGTYTLEEKNYSHGYRVTFTMVVKDGKISESKYDNVDKDGKSKVDDKAYNEQMKKIAKTDPKEYIAKLNEEFVKNFDTKKNDSEIEVVTGATESSHGFITYAEQLINAAQAGKTDKIEVDNVVYGE